MVEPDFYWFTITIGVSIIYVICIKYLRKDKKGYFKSTLFDEFLYCFLLIILLRITIIQTLLFIDKYDDEFTIYKKREHDYYNTCVSIKNGYKYFIENDKCTYYKIQLKSFEFYRTIFNHVLITNINTISYNVSYNIIHSLEYKIYIIIFISILQRNLIIPIYRFFKKKLQV